MKILTIADIHNDVENLMIYIDKLNELDFDVIVFPGDVVDVTLPKGFTQIEVARLILEELRALNKPILALPGNQDKEVIDFLEKEGVSIHGSGRIIDDVGFYGFGGAKTPFGTSYEPGEKEIEDGLKKAYKEVESAKIKVQVTHNPPLNTKTDIIPSGAHVGSAVVRKFIEAKQPALAIAAHIHEARAIDQIGKTKIINSGRFPEGYVGLVEIVGENVSAKIINLI